MLNLQLIRIKNFVVVRICLFFPRNVVHKGCLCRHAVSVLPDVRHVRVIISLNFFTVS